MATSSFITTLENWLTTTEDDVMALVAKIKTEAALVQSEIHAALHWIAGNVPTIAADVESVLGIISVIGIGSNPAVATAIAAANTAVTALNAFAQASTSGKTDAQAVIVGYQAVKEAQAAAATARAIMAAAPVTKLAA